MEAADVQPKQQIKYGVEHNDKDPKSKVGDHVRISEYKKFFAKGYIPSQCEKVFVIKKVTNTVTWEYVTTYLKGAEIV